MLSRENRLSKQKDFDLVYQSGRQFHGPHLVVRVAKSDEKELKFGVVISKKVAPRAVDRNRLKRQIGEIIRPAVRKLKDGIKAIIIAKKGILEMDYKSLAAELASVGQKAGLWN